MFNRYYINRREKYIYQKKEIMKTITIMLALLLLTSAFADHRLKIFKKDGTTDLVTITNDTQITFSEGNPLHRMKVLKSDNSNDVYNLSDVVIITFSTTGILEEKEKLKEIPVSLLKNYPNPFNPSTVISFETARAGLVTVAVYNQQGQLIKELLKENLTAGQHQLKWDAASNSSSGVYFTKVSLDGATKVNRMTLIK